MNNTNTNNLKPYTKFWGEFQVQPDGKLKIVKAQKLTILNQYKTTWRNVNSRNLARTINNSVLVIK